MPEIVLLLFLLLPRTGRGGRTTAPNIACHWTFDSCSLGTHSNCIATLKKPCGPSPREKTESLVFLHDSFFSESKGANYSDLCTTSPWCSIRPAWCQWGPWTLPVATCGSAAGRLTRQRSPCCHPVTLRTDSRVRCGDKVGREERSTQWAPCVPQEGGRGQLSPSYLWNVFIAGVTAVVMIAIIALVCYRRCPHRLPWRRDQPDNVPVHFRPILRPDRPPPAYENAWRIDAKNTESPPPKYEAALQYAL